MASQTELGKAFEYACIDALYKRYTIGQAVVVKESPQMRTARAYYEKLAEQQQMDLLAAAAAAVRIIEQLEPQLKNPGFNIPLLLTLQTDARGIAGDVRDVLCIRESNSWQIGLSCKHNHHAVKHSRLSDKIDFGKEWFEKNCSQTYFNEVIPLFTELRKLRDEGKEKGIPVLWNDIPNKFEQYYVPVLQSFMDELNRLDKQYTGEIPKLLIQYLIGRYDFYKVITDDRHRSTRVEAVNIEGTLNRSADNIGTLVKIPTLKLPSKFYHIGFKDNSKNTIEVVCDEGWTVSMRLHNASSKVEPSLKFDVNLLSLPASIHAQVRPWETIELDGYGEIDMQQAADPWSGYFNAKT